MKTLNIGDVKSNFSEIMKDVKKGEKIAIAFGKKREIIGYIVPELVEKKQPKRKLGIWEGKATFEWVGDGKITVEEFLGLE